MEDHRDTLVHAEQQAFNVPRGTRLMASASLCSQAGGAMEAESSLQEGESWEIQGSSCTWNDRQCHVRGIRPIMVNGLDCWQQYSLCSKLPTRVGMAIKAWEIATGDLQTDAMPSLEDVTGGPEVNCVSVDLARLDKLWAGC
jgi:hypothetical protein